MLVDKMQNNGSFFNAKIKEKEKSVEEFQATLNAIKDEQRQEQKETLKKDKSLVNEDLDLSALQNDFSLYAWNKLRESQHRKNEETMLNKLFNVIDVNNANR
ncbi:hypothetical protein [Campylobacter vulpis]|uniref:Invasion antigen C n=1 Tax=Campylobacter vulpis TaxID=1655500 RepID=A0A2G4R0Q2_9BACT|nr:hypothetical protein [Campylobacter vulpis]MBS4241274.1 hypothetical protein [Campylobacter vulpis]MBS4252631.1 hypothetical protein [Campylobacter vulpis]MBS4274836.1 hypothetical protein [Campylobacter vulpis]MBS4281914.1 hypothetical protein [Campylobacter vulpis]MBS4306415.1 hypothetical protein [Campylobacter vulpis]